MAGAINSWNAAKPAAADYIDVSQGDIANNYAAIAVMVGALMQNLVLTQSSASPAVLTITADRLALFNTDTVPLCYVARSANLTATITASGANGLDTGSEAASTWYFAWAIYDPTNDVLASLLSTSATAPTMPSGYTFKRLVGAVRNDGSSNFIAFVQRGNRVTYKAVQSMVSSGAATSYTQIAMAALLPSIAKRVIGQAYPKNTTNNEYTRVYLADDSSGNYAILLAGICRTTNSYTGLYFELELVADIDVYYKIETLVGTGSATLEIIGYYVEI